MNESDEYIKFWASVSRKAYDIQMEYSKLSELNKKRIDQVKQSIMHANTFYDILKVINEQLR